MRDIEINLNDLSETETYEQLHISLDQDHLDDEFGGNIKDDDVPNIEESFRQAPRYAVGNCLDKLKELSDQSVQCCVTSPPYWGLRDYGHKNQIGREKGINLYVKTLVEVFREVKRVLTDDGTLFLNLGDKYRDKSALGLPWRVAFALIEEGWILRNANIWEKPNAVPESVKDRFTTSHETVFFFSKSKKYYFNSKANLEPYATDVSKRGNASAIQSKAVDRNHEVKSLSAQAAATGRTQDSFFKNGGRNKRDVWTIPTEQGEEAHFAPFPQKLVKTCLLPATRKGDLVIDPFNGSGTTGIVCFKSGRRYIGFDLNPDYVAISIRRFHNECFPGSFEFVSRVDPRSMEQPEIVSNLSTFEEHAAWLKSDLEIAEEKPEASASTEGQALDHQPNFENLIEEWLTPKQVAELLGVSTKSVYRWNSEGHLHGQKFGPRLIKFRRSEVLALLPQRKGKESI